MDRAAQAEGHVKAAQKAAKSGLFKKPDWDVAAVEWDGAANLFLLLKQTDRAVECYAEAFEAHQKAGNLFFAGRSAENIARIAEEKASVQKATMWLEKAAAVYGEDGKPDKRAATLTKAARLALEDSLDHGLELLEQAVTIYVEEEKWHLSADAFRLLTSTYLKHGRWREAVASIERKVPGFLKMEQPHNVHKAYTEIVIIHLAAKDTVAAEKAFEAAMQTPGFAASDGASACERLLRAYTQGDEEGLAEYSKDQTFTFLATDVARLVRSLQTTGVKRPAEGSAAANPRKPNDPLAPTADTEELQEDFLC